MKKSFAAALAVSAFTLAACGGSGYGPGARVAAGSATLAYSPAMYSTGPQMQAPAQVSAPQARAVAPAPASAPARIGMAMVNPITGQEAFTTDRALSADEQMRYAADYCRSRGLLLDTAAFKAINAPDALGAMNADGVFCR